MKALIATVIMFIFHAVGIFGLYGMFDWYDIPMHVLGGVVAALWGLEYIHLRSIKLRPVDKVVAVIGIASFIAVIWELHEFILDIFTAGVRQPSNTDTMIDFIMDYIGVSVVIAFMRYED